jgi:nucleoside-diphosphate-sugar epimerase
MRTVLVTGASGVVGRSAVQAFDAAGWRVLAASRRAPSVVSGGAGEIVDLPLDLTDTAACRDAIAAWPQISHLVYAAVAELPGLVAGWRDRATMQTNLAMFENVLAPLCAGGALRHVSILQGGKAYGAHLHPVPVPAREDGPRDDHDNFYWLHEDAVRAAAARHGFAFTVIRPPVIVGGAVGAGM